MLINPLLILAAIQIIIESLPISSSGHVLLAQELFKRYAGMSAVVLPEHVDHFLHGPTILIIGIYFFKTWWHLVKMVWLIMVTWIRRGFCYRALPDSHKKALNLFLSLAGMVVIADSILILCYALRSGFMKYDSYPNAFGIPLPTIGFTVTGLLLLSTVLIKKSPRTMGNKFLGALMVGIAQGIGSFLPGLSRFASTFVVGRWVGFSARRSFQFSFLIFFPLMMAAFLLHGVPELFHNVLFSAGRTWLILGMATVLAYFCFWLVGRMIMQGYIWWLGWYMLVPTIMSLFLSGS